MVLIEKIGWGNTAEQIEMSCKYTNPRVSHDNKYWYLSVRIEESAEEIKITEESIGVDLGLKDLAICSNGMKLKNINKTRSMKQLEKRLRRLQRQVSRKYENNKEGNTFVKTSNIIKITQKIKLIYRRITNIRNNHIHQVTSSLVKAKPRRIVIENLNVSGMMKNRHLAKAVAAQKFHDFRKKLEYKCEKYGMELIIADRWYPSSKICSACGNIKSDLKLSDRIYRCKCGLIIDRDYNASLNLANY